MAAAFSLNVTGGKGLAMRPCAAYVRAAALMMFSTQLARLEASMPYTLRSMLY